MGGITLRVAIYRSNNSLTSKTHLNLFYAPCYGLKHISMITFVFQNKNSNQQKLNKITKEITEKPHSKQMKTPMCHPSPTLQVFFSFTSIFRCRQYGFMLLAGDGFFSSAFVVLCGQGRKREGMLGEWKR